MKEGGILFHIFKFFILGDFRPQGFFLRVRRNPLPSMPKKVFPYDRSFFTETLKCRNAILHICQAYYNSKNMLQSINKCLCSHTFR